MSNKSFSARFYRLAQILFTNEIEPEDIEAAKNIIDHLKKTETDMESWIESVENNLNVLANYKGKETGLVIISETYEETIDKQKERYEKIIEELKQIIEAISEIKDVEMHEMIANITGATEEFSDTFNELVNLSVNIGDEGFIQQFKEASQKIIDQSESFFEVIQRIRDYILKNVLHEFSLS